VDCVFDADKLTGLYNEVLTINGDFTFDVSARALFDIYGLGGGNADQALLGGNEALVDGSYGIYALFKASGSVDPVTGEITFDTTGASVDLYIDVDQDNTYTPPGSGTGDWTVGNDGEDELVLSSTTLSEGSGELDPPVGGFFDLNFIDLILSAFGEDYYPTLASLSLVFATVDGDFDTIPSPPIPATYTVKGDLSVVYDVPEPATLSLLGLGLFGAGIAARRRRQSVS
jgi:hypothetical protein